LSDRRTGSPIEMLSIVPDCRIKPTNRTSILTRSGWNSRVPQALLAGSSAIRLALSQVHRSIDGDRGQEKGRATRARLE
jgi:hypothetical protein